jgi:DNA-binding MarR family transcriptional regulator
MGVEVSEVGECVVGNLRHTVRVVDRVYAAALAGSGVGRSQFSMLNVIAERDGLSVGVLGERLDMERSAVFRQLRGLEERGWVARVRSAEDGRQVLLRLTGAGELGLAALHECWRQAQDQVLEAFGKDRWRALRGELAALQTVVAR